MPTGSAPFMAAGCTRMRFEELEQEKMKITNTYAARITEKDIPFIRHPYMLDDYRPHPNFIWDSASG